MKMQRSATWALLVGFSICAVPPFAKTQNPGNTPSTRQSQTNDIAIASGRMIVHPPAHPLLLGEKNLIEITLKGPDVLCLMPSTAADDEGCSPVQRRPDGKTYVDVVPTELGVMELDFMVVFADHALESETVQVTVVPPRPPLRLDVGEMMPNGKSMVYLTVGESVRIGGQAEFAGLPNPVPIPEKDLKYRVIQTKGMPAIQVDLSTGTLEAERVGDALIESSYAGTRQTTCVMVREHQGYTPGNCEELREGGDRILPTARVRTRRAQT